MAALLIARERRKHQNKNCTAFCFDFYLCLVMIIINIAHHNFNFFFFIYFIFYFQRLKRQASQGIINIIKSGMPRQLMSEMCAHCTAISLCSLENFLITTTLAIYESSLIILFNYYFYWFITARQFLSYFSAISDDV